MVQWRVVTLSTLVQRWGRAARGPGRTGLAVLLVEPAAYTYNPTEPGQKEPDQKQSKSKSQSPKGRNSLKEPLRKGGFQSMVPGAQPELHDNSPYEGTLAMVQTKGCHRKIWTEVFQNQPVREFTSFPHEHTLSRDSEVLCTILV